MIHYVFILTAVPFMRAAENITLNIVLVRGMFM